MPERRRFHRIMFNATCTLEYNGMTYEGRVENLSLNGALVSFSEGVMIPQGDSCHLQVLMGGESTPLMFVVNVIYSCFMMIGVQFDRFEADTSPRLYALMEKETTEKGVLRQELLLLSRSSD